MNDTSMFLRDLCSMGILILPRMQCMPKADQRAVRRTESIVLL